MENKNDDSTAVPSEDMSKGLEVTIKDFEARGDVNLPDVQSTSLIQLALEKKYDPALIEKMMDLQERQETRLAKQAYNKAMAAFKADPPKVWKDIQVKYEAKGQVQSWSHADLGIAAEAINRSLGEHGLNSTWRTLPLENNRVRVTCIIAHELGHSEETYLEAGPDTTGSKNEIQALGSSVFYLERYTLFALSGLAPARMDDDGIAGGPVEYINNEQKKTITDLIETAKDGDLAVFLTWAKVDSLDEIPKNEFSKAVAALKVKQ